MTNSNLLCAIGNTPLVKLESISSELKGTIWAKLEYMNPGGSIKDRIAKYMIEKAEQQGRLKPGDTIIENSSGNTAMGLALVARQKGYRLKIVIRDTTSQEKLKMLEILGVDVIKVDASLDPAHEESYNQLAANMAQADPQLFYIDQHQNLDNNETYYKTLGPELWEQTRGELDCLVAAVGTGGTLCGTGKYLKEQNPNIKLVGMDPMGSVFYDWFKSRELITPYPYLIEGMGDEFLIKTAQLDLLDEMYQVTDKKAFGWTKKLAFEEGILAGGSSGAALYGAVRLAKELDQDVNIVTVFPDSGYKYFSTIYNDEWLQQHQLI